MPLSTSLSPMTLSCATDMVEEQRKRDYLLLATVHVCDKDYGSHINLVQTGWTTKQSSYENVVRSIYHCMLRAIITVFIYFFYFCDFTI